MKWSGVCVIVTLTVLIAVSSSEDVKDKKSKEQVKFGNHQNRISKGMFDNELYNSKKQDQSAEDIEDNDDTKKDSNSEEKDRKDELNNILEGGVSNAENRQNDDSNDGDDITDELSYRDAITNIPYSTQKYGDPYHLNLNRGGWNDYDKYYYYGQESDDPAVFRKKRNMDITRPGNALKRTPRKRAPLHTPLEQLMRSRSGLKRRSVRVKRDISTYYQAKLAELLAEIAEKKAREEDQEKYLRFQESLLSGYNREDQDGTSGVNDMYPYKLPPYVTKQLKDDLSMINSPSEMDSSEDDDMMRSDNDAAAAERFPEESDMPTFFRRPYQRRSDSTFYPAPNAYQWLVSGQKRSQFNPGRWGPIEDKRKIYDSDIEEEIEELDPAKLYLFASLLDGEDQNGPLSPQKPRKRLIL